MVLGRALIDATGEAHEMAGLLELETSFAKRKLHLGYRQAQTRGQIIRWALSDFDCAAMNFTTRLFFAKKALPFALARDAYSDDERPAGLARNGVSGSFFHLMA